MKVYKDTDIGPFVPETDPVYFLKQMAEKARRRFPLVQGHCALARGPCRTPLMPVHDSGRMGEEYAGLYRLVQQQQTSPVLR